MTTQSNYSLQNFDMNNAKVLTGNSQPVPDFKWISTPIFFKLQNKTLFRQN